MTEFLKWLRENNVVGFFLLLIFIGGIISTVYIMKAIARFKKIEKTCGDIPEMDKKINIGVNLSGSIEKKIDAQAEKFSLMATNITALISFLTTKHTDLQSGLFQSFSPIQLTVMGKDVLTKSGGLDYIEKNIDSLMLNMESQVFKSALDVQNYASALIIQLFNTDDFIHIRNYIFKNPVYKGESGVDIPINIHNINQVMGIYLRDKYFTKHPDLKDAEDTSPEK